MKHPLRKSHSKKRGNDFNNFFIYRYLSGQKGIGYFLRLISLLYVPITLVVSYCLVFRAYEVVNIDGYFLICGVVGSIWFIVGPYLIYKCIKQFIALQTNLRLNDITRSYFSENKYKHYKEFLVNLVLMTALFSAILIGGIIYEPRILTENISKGFHDPMFYIVVLFLLYFGAYASTALSFILLVSKIIYTNVKLNLFDYNPIDSIGESTISEIAKYSGTIVKYFCSGLLFLPYAWYFLFFKEAYAIWAVALLSLYGVFLLISIIFPKIQLGIYIRARSNELELVEQENYMHSVKDMISNSRVRSKSPVAELIEEQLRLYNYSCYIREIKVISHKGIQYFDFNSVITYLSIIVTIVSTVFSLFSV